MCHWYPTTCALRDDHAGPHLTPDQLNTTVTQAATNLDDELANLKPDDHPAQ